MARAPSAVLELLIRGDPERLPAQRILEVSYLDLR
jgi:hypothetical protein